MTVGLCSLEWTNGLLGGVSSVGAERVLAGEIPYRDFWTMYAPGHFYALAFVYYIFGTHLWVETVSATVVVAAGGCAIFLLARKCGGTRTLSGICSLVFLAALFNTGYIKYFGSYPITILLVLAILNFLVDYFENGRRAVLFWAGLTAGAVLVFKHDVGGYTVISSVLGLAAYHLVKRRNANERETWPSVISAFVIYGAAAALLSIPVYFYFAMVAGSDMLRDLLIFPLTDFPFSRPETYPGLIPRAIRGGSNLKTLVNFCNYLVFNIPYLLLILGTISAVFAFRKRKHYEFALIVMFSSAFLFHYNAAHVQINTHIISLSIYSSLLAVVLFTISKDFIGFASSKLPRMAGIGFACMWLAALLAAPAYNIYMKSGVETAVLTLPKVDGLRIESDEAAYLSALSSLVDKYVSQDETIYIGLNRHDALLIGDTRLYFILNRPSATKYHELHPAITDTTPVQIEMIEEIRNKNVRMLVLKHIFNDEIVEKFKKDFLKTLPNIGATELDSFIRENYAEHARYGQYAVWLKKETELHSANP
ncbi:MAG: hypothetical protein ACT4O9_09945 [Blastocatellia bacterium]